MYKFPFTLLQMIQFNVYKNGYCNDEFTSHRYHNSTYSSYSYNSATQMFHHDGSQGQKFIKWQPVKLVYLDA